MMPQPASSPAIPPGPLGGSFAWRAEAFQNYDSWVLHVTPADVVPFRPGDIQYIHNHVVFHARAAYIDHPPPAPKRHLMRMWLSASDGRELPQALLAKWPVVERGKLRGGAVIAPDHEWIVPLEAETPAY